MIKPFFSSPTGSASLGRVPGSEFHNDRHDHLHGGIDLNAPMWHPIGSPKAGVVTFAGLSYGLGGNKIHLDHGTRRDGKHHETKHYHFGYKGQPWKDCIVVREGDRVKRGQLIGYCGVSGNATGPHDHYEHYVNGRAVDPLQYLWEYQVYRNWPLLRFYALAYPKAEGPDIPILQQRLAAHGYLPGPIDGIYGLRTLIAVEAFQRDHGLTVDGIVGRNTWKALL